MPVVQQWPVKTSATNAVTESHTGPATTQGNTLVVIDVCRDNTSTNASITDNGGNTWALGPVMVSPDTSVCQRLFYCTAAAPTTQVHVNVHGADGVSGPGGAGHSAIVFELVGSLELVDYGSILNQNVQTSATSTAAPISVPESGALVLSTLSAGVTNRSFVPVDDGRGWASLEPVAVSQMRLFARWVEVNGAATVNHSWKLESGAATSVGHVSAAFAATSSPDPDPEPVATTLRRVNTNGTLTPVRLGWAYPDHIDYGDMA